MDFTLHIPDDVAERLGGDLPRRALEALVAEEYRNGRLSKAELQRLLGIETSYETDAFLKQHGIFDEYSIEEFDAELRAVREATLR